MGKKRRNFTLMVIVAFVPLIAIAYFLSLGYAVDLGFDSQISSDIMNSAPGVFLFIMGVAIISYIELGNPVIVAGFTLIGIGMAYLVQQLYNASIITIAMLYPATLIQLQELIIIGSAMLGGVACFSGRR